MERRAQVTWVLLLGALVLAASSALAEGGLRRSMRLSEEIRTLKERTEALRERNARLRYEIDALRSDPRAMERAAREELGFVRPDELVFSLEGL